MHVDAICHPMSHPTIVSILARLAKWLTLAATALLGVFTLRRWFFTWVAARAQPRLTLTGFTPPILWLTPMRNEEAALPGLLAAIDRLTYPELTIVLIDDASTDATAGLAEAWASRAPERFVLRLPQPVGKAQALNLALAAFGEGEFVAIYDADERPQPDALRQLMAPLADARVAASSGQRRIDNALAGPAAAYAAFESLVHQRLTVTAKDSLNLAPPSLGSHCVYRRRALAAVGGFRPGALLEDSDLTVRLARQGWRLRYTPTAVSCQAAPATLAAYWQQHTRWARGFHAVAWQNRPILAGRAPMPGFWLRLELTLFAVGYADRLAWPLALWGARRQPWLRPLLAASLLTPLWQVGLALRLTRAPAVLWRRLGWLLPFWLVDVAGAVWATWLSLWRRPRTWTTRR